VEGSGTLRDGLTTMQGVSPALVQFDPVAATGECVDIEVLEPDWGNRSNPIAQCAHLMGITYERRTRSLELELDSADHRIVEPAEVWVLEEPDGFLSALEVVYDDGSREVVSIKRVGIRQRR